MTSHEKEQIRQMRIAGRGYRQIADALNYPVATIKSFCRRQGLLDKSLAENTLANTCQQCGGQLMPSKLHRPKRFCSDRCRYRWWNVNRQLRRTDAMGERQCSACGSLFRAYDKRRTYCSRRCYFTTRFRKDDATLDQ